MQNILVKKLKISGKSMRESLNEQKFIGVISHRVSMEKLAKINKCRS